MSSSSGKSSARNKKISASATRAKREYANVVIYDEVEGGETEVVAPSSWVDHVSYEEAPFDWGDEDSYDILWWPAGSAKKLTKFHMNNGTKPNKEIWTMYRIIRVKTVGDREKCEAVPITDESTVEQSFVEEEADDNRAFPMEPPCLMREAGGVTSSPESSRKRPMSAADLMEQFPLTEQDFQYKLFKAMASMERKVLERFDNLSERITALENSAAVGAVATNNHQPVAMEKMRACETIEDFSKLDEDLENEEYFRQKIEELRLVAGDNVRRSCYRLCLYMMTNAVLMQFSLKGKKKKPAFNATNVYNLLVAAIQRIHGVIPTSAVDEELSERILRFAKRRSGKTSNDEELEEDNELTD